MDFFRKLVSDRLRAAAAGPHPETGDISAFAENVLPERERSQVLAHLSDCGTCREILFLSLPQGAEGQKILPFSPKRSTRFALRWGAVVASVVVVAAVVVVRYDSEHRRAPMQASIAATGQNKIAEEKVPKELDELRDRLPASGYASKAVTNPPTVNAPTKERPLNKPMTAKPNARLDFDNSDQVHVASGADAATRSSGGMPQAKQFDAFGNTASSASPAPSADKDQRQFQQMAQLQSGAAKGAEVALSSSGAPSKDDANHTELNSAGRNLNPAFDSASGAAANQVSANGNLAGVVLDPSGAVVRDANVTMNGPQGTKISTADDKGNFAFNGIAPGQYSVKAEASGFKTVELTQVAVAANENSNVKMTLEPGTTSETVEVNAEAAQVNISSAAVAHTEVSSALVPAPQQTAELARKKGANAQKMVVVGGLGKTKAPAFHWMLSRQGKVQRSNDSGRNWQLVSVPGGKTFHALSAVDTSVWVGGTAGTLFHSSDSGETWTRVVPVVNGQTLQSDVTHIDFSDLLNGTVTTSNGDWRTSDGGISWRK